MDDVAVVGDAAAWCCCAIVATAFLGTHSATMLAAIPTEHCSPGAPAPSTITGRPAGALERAVLQKVAASCCGIAWGMRRRHPPFQGKLCLWRIFVQRPAKMRERSDKRPRVQLPVGSRGPGGAIRDPCGRGACGAPHYRRTGGG